MEQNLLTADAYTCPKIFQQEQESIFSKSWTFAGLVEELAEPNDFLTIQAGNNNILVFMNAEGELKAFHNICRHRGMRLVEGSGKLNSKITCPYHDWTYSQGGELKSLPKQRGEFEGINKQCLSLKPANVGIWRGMIWVHPEHECEPVTTYFKPMERYLATYLIEDLIEAKDYRYEVEIAANWKLIVENYIDHYHLAQLHAGTLNMYQHKTAEFGFADEHFYFKEALTPDYLEDIEKQAPYPLLIEQPEKMAAWVPMLFPCLGLAETESSWSVFQIIPLAADKTRVIVRSKVKACSQLTYMKQAYSSYSFWRRKVKAKDARFSEEHALGSGDFMKEDVYVCEQLQKSLNSPYFEFGPSASHGESPIRGFQQRVIAKMKA